MLTLFQAVVLGALQGASELFPISSLGHSVILPALFGWHVDQRDPFFLIFLVATHFATAVVLFFFFFDDWKRIIRGLFRSFREREIKKDDRDAKLAWLLVISTIPAGVLGLIFESQIRGYLITPRAAAFFLAMNGILLFVAEMLRRKSEGSGKFDAGTLEVIRASQLDAVTSDERIVRMTRWQGIRVGTMQALALIPGFSRTGAALAGGLLIGLSHEDAIRFSFLLATPIIAAAAVLKIPELFMSFNREVIMIAGVGAVASAVTAYLSVKFLTKYFEFEGHKLTPFAAYCFAAGILATAWFMVGR